MKNKTRHPLYRTWQNMIARCENPSCPSYKNYGARGIKVCERWRNSFELFVSDMGEKPSPMYSLDRINVNGGYQPDNCRWATRSEQARNKRAARYVTIDGNQIHVAELSENTGIDPRTLFSRASKGWDNKKILSKEPQWNNAESQKKAVKVHAEMKKAQTHCKRGHLLSGDNLYSHKGRRHCRACRRAQDRFLYYQKKRPLEDFL